MYCWIEWNNLCICVVASVVLSCGSASFSVLASSFWFPESETLIIKQFLLHLHYATICLYQISGVHLTFWLITYLYSKMIPRRFPIIIVLLELLVHLLCTFLLTIRSSCPSSLFWTLWLLWFKHVSLKHLA